MNGGTLVRRGLVVAAVLGGSIGALVGLAGTAQAPGPDGTATLTQHFSPGEKIEQVSWSVVRNDGAEHSGVVTFDRPDGCEAPAPTTTPPTTAPPATAPVTTVAAPTTVASPTAAPQPNVAPASSGAPLPVTGSHPSPVLWMGLLALTVGAFITWLSRRRPEELSSR